MDDRSRLLHLIKTKSYEEGVFKLSSGGTSSFYFDGKQTTLFPEGAYLVGKLFFQLVRQSPTPIQGVGGMTLGADPIATSIALVSFLEGEPIPAFIVRKEPKKHGKSAWIEGMNNIPPGAHVAIVEDVTTTARSTLLAIEKVKEEGMQVALVLAVVDREQGARENLERAGYTLHSLFTVGDLR